MKHQLKQTRALISGLIALITLSGAAHAAIIPLLDIPAATSGSAGVEGIDGVAFTPSTDIEVTHLGYYDQGGDGLPGIFQAAIYNFDTEVLISEIADITTTSTLGANNFRYEPITPVTLNSGQTYLLAAYVPAASDYALNLSTNPPIASGVTYDGYYYDSNTGGMAFPTTPGGDIKYYGGPNLKFSAVPEPGTYALFAGIATLGFVAVRRKKAKVA